VKAYKSPDFMLGPEARTVRMLAEYLEPQARFRRLGVNRAIIFWGSARLGPGQRCGPKGADYYAAARTLAGRLARWTTETHREGERYYLCTGGGPGIMEAVNRGAAEVNAALSMGLNISLPHEQSSNAYISDALNVEFHYFFLRKFWFVNLARALVIFPGGFGTMDELFELLTLIQCEKKSRIPVLLFGKSFWEKLINFPMFAEDGLISRTDLDMMYLTDDMDDAFDYLTKGLKRGAPINQSKRKRGLGAGRLADRRPKARATRKKRSRAG
jgi:uncharacterized protein (TIGR00730 family)